MPTSFSGFTPIIILNKINTDYKFSGIAYIMPGRGKGRKRKAVETVEAPVELESTGNKGQTIDFQSIIEASGVLPKVVECTVKDSQSEAIAIESEGCGGGFPGSGLNRTRCLSDEVFGHVPMSLREKIWKDQYVNISLLLKGLTLTATLTFSSSAIFFFNQDLIPNLKYQYIDNM